MKDIIDGQGNEEVGALLAVYDRSCQKMRRERFAAAMVHSLCSVDILSGVSRELARRL